MYNKVSSRPLPVIFNCFDELLTRIGFSALFSLSSLPLLPSFYLFPSLGYSTTLRLDVLQTSPSCSFFFLWKAMLLSMLSKRSIRSDVCLVSPKLQNKLSAMSLPATLQVSELKREEYSARILEQACWIWDIIDSIAGFESVFEVWSWMA